MRVFQWYTSIFLVMLLVNLCNSQPLKGSKRIIEGIAVYTDAENPRLYYYEPGELMLAVDGSGKPDFQFLDLRYTGNKCNADIGTKNFMSLVQFGIEMKKMSPAVRKLIIKKLGRAELKPLPLSSIATRLILPKETTEANSYQPIGTDGSTQATSAKGYNSTTAYWSKRYFTTRLNKHESQLLNKQLTNGHLGLSLSYSYYVKMMLPEEATVSGSEEFRELVAEKDSISEENALQNVLINSHTISIEIDTEKHPDAIKQIDLNEEIPPSYAAVEIKCYDFSKGLRPDLYMKILEVEAISVNNDKPIITKLQFTKKDTDIFTRYLNFPYAVQTSKPMRYRISEISKKGEKQTFEWIEKPDCTSVIDISAKIEDQKTEEYAVDIELNADLFAEGIERIEVQFSFILNGKNKNQITIFSPDEPLLKTLIFEKDKNTEISYKTNIENSEETNQEIVEKTVTDTYIYVNSL
ncbi:hypothetical protein [Ascidiimonas sp. W6]|uniref:hypothetical protein n=1 Tax=Ascidiimonas meishanensis TaxID=3128903 RepID=UPI0030EB8445